MYKTSRTAFYQYPHGPPICNSLARNPQGRIRFRTMPIIGKTNTLQVIKEVDFGLYLDGEELGEILLPKRYVPENCAIDDWLDVFLYLDSEDDLIATTEIPYVEIGECACLNVIDVNSYGAFMDWGLSKDLFVPFKEQRVPMRKGGSYVVCVFEDNTGRICASSKLDSFLEEQSNGDFTAQQEVDLLIASRSPLGYKAVIDGSHLGLIHNSDAFIAIELGQRITGYIKNVRPDGAIDLMLQKRGEGVKLELSQRIMQHLRDNGGQSDLTDKSSSEDIYACYQASKGSYKKAIGQLYKEKKILLTKDKITLA